MERVRSNYDQFLTMLDFMERHGDLSKPQLGLVGRVKCDRLWVELTRQLNACDGGVRKSAEKWKKVWADWKSKSKKKYLCAKATKKDVGGSSKLTPLEERVVAIIKSSKPLIDPIRDSEQSRASEVSKRAVKDSTLNESIIFSEPTLGQNSPKRANIQCVFIESFPSPLPPPSPQPEISPVHSPESPDSPKSIPSQTLRKSRKKKSLTPFERSTEAFTAIERLRVEREDAREICRLKYKEEQDKRVHEREMEKLRLEAQRLEVDRVKNQLLNQLCVLGERLIEAISQK